ncbi:MAG: hypothetical protein CVT48_00570, partial [Thermoplasmata archaeon HGW-Thermoplasmata-1]
MQAYATLMKKVCVIRGDGIGPDVVDAALHVVDAAMGVGALDLFEADAGLSCYKKTGSYLPEDTIAAIGDSDAVLFGAISSPDCGVKDYRPVVPRIRREFDLYANLRPFSNYLLSSKEIDILLVRENTEGLYGVPEEEDAEGVTTFRRITRKGCERISKFAFDLACERKRSKVTCAHKANVLRKSDGLFRQIFYEQAESSMVRQGDSYSCSDDLKTQAAAAASSNERKIVADDIFIDNCAMQLILNPQRFDVIVTLNLYGDILSDELAGLVGGLGFAPSANIGDDLAMFEPVHGSAPDIAGRGIANPTAAILSAAMML